MKTKPVLAAALVLAAVGGGAAWWLTRVPVADVAAASLPATPDTAGWPAEFRQRIERGAADVRGGVRPAEALATLARLYHANGFYAEAALCYQGLEQIQPGEARWPHLLALIVAGYGRVEEAIPLWERAVDRAPGYLPARVRLGEALAKCDRTAEAAKVFEAVLQREPGHPYALLGLARLDVAAGRWAAARDRLEEASAKTNYAIGGDLLPTVYEKLGRNDRALALRGRGKAQGAYYDVPDPWLESIDADCYDTYRLSLAAGLTAHRGKPLEGLALLERAVALAPNDPRLHFQLGGVWLAQQDYTKARAAFERCTQLAPDFSDGWANLTFILRRVGDGPGAERALQAGLRNCPRSPGLRLEYGRRLRAAGKREAALEQFREAARFRPDEAEPFLEVATELVALDRVDEAVRELERGLQAEPMHPAVLSTLVMAEVQRGNAVAAATWLRQAREQPRIAERDRTTLEAAFRERFGRAAP